MYGQAAPAFDLIGPKVDVRVKRGEVTLPIGQVPNLLPGDRLWIHPDFPESQSTRFVLIVSFLRGATNPPPPEWFTRVDTWSKKAREEGVFVTVPEEAQQAIVFLAPATGGDFSTLRNAVKGRPGTFVRATQDLQSASLDRMRLDSYLAEVKVTSQSDPKLLKDRAQKAASVLGIKLDQQCFDKPTDQQAPCLVQHTEGMVLDDANVSNRVSQLTSGNNADLMNQLSYSTLGGAGVYSPYIGAIVDTARILASLHTAHFQYIPALALPTEDTLNLRLNVPPSFRDPKSVVVVALPPVGPAKMPPLHPVNPAEEFCAQKSGLVLAAEGAPLVYATPEAHDLKLHVETKTGPVDIPLKADASQGGLVLDHAMPQLPPGEVFGTVKGKWGFDDWEGPKFHLLSAESGKWNIVPGDESALVVGREDTLHIVGASTLCTDKVEAQSTGASAIELQWKSPKPNTLEIGVPMKDAAPGPVTISIHQYGMDKPDKLTLTAYSEAASLDKLKLNAGENEALLTGNRLDEVAKVTLNGISWTPTDLRRVQDLDQLKMTANGDTSNLEPGKRYTAKVQLRDQRELKVPVSVDPPRPQVTLLSKGTQDEASAEPSPVHLGSPNDLPVDGRLVFFLKSKTPTNFPRDEKVEVGAADNSFHTTLSVSDGTLVLEDASTALGVVEPLAKFGSSAFGPLQARAISADGTPGEWISLGTLVRLPGFKELHCPHSPARPCSLTGTNLFLAESVAASPDFDNAVDVPSDFTGTLLIVPHPVNGMLYLKLRDDPATVQTLALAAMPLTPGTTVPVTPLAPTAVKPAADSKPVDQQNAQTPAPPPAKNER
ncbi:hypothetical protein P8935_04325 [Telmatobacter sp. DSM 110680]|uniref:Uncharacterized protein n=1 Tax=Telmatobacter sp. DSM 110680 TaxID=3036704 RepID=A0AAU7DLN3_9BACT